MFLNKNFILGSISPCNPIKKVQEISTPKEVTSVEPKDWPLGPPLL